MRLHRLQPRQAWLLLRLWLGLSVGIIVGSVGALDRAPTLLAQTGANQAGLVVLHGDGRVVTACVAFDEPEISGMALLQRSGLELNIDAGSGMGGTVCRIDSEGCSVPQESCFCRCEGTSCTYWSYWRKLAASWEYASLGAGNSVVQPGDVDGWVWGQGTVGNAGTPPSLTLAEICQAGSTATPTEAATNTATAIPTPTTEATPTAEATPTPLTTSTATATWVAPSTAFADPPRIELFAADRVELATGDTVTLQWRVVNAASVILRAGGQAVAVDAAGTTLLAPPTSIEVQLEASNHNGVSSSVVQLMVRTPLQTPIALPAAIPTTAVLPTVLPATPLPQPAVAAAAPLLPLAAATQVAGVQENSPQAQVIQQRIQLPLIIRGADTLPVAESDRLTNSTAPSAAGVIRPTTAATAASETVPVSPTAAPMATHTPSATVAVAAVLLPTASLAARVGPPISSAAMPESSQATVGLAGAALGALGALLLLPAGIGVGIYLLWRMAKMLNKR